MHYGDPKHIKNSELQVVVYKHVDGTYGEGNYDYEICSIYGCKYIDMYKLSDFWDRFENMYPDELKKLKEENFYLVTFKMDKNHFNPSKYEADYNVFKWIKAKKITTEMIKKDPFLGLH